MPPMSSGGLQQPQHEPLLSDALLPAISDRSPETVESKGDVDGEGDGDEEDDDANVITPKKRRHCYTFGQKKAIVSAIDKGKTVGEKIDIRTREGITGQQLSKFRHALEQIELSTAQRPSLKRRKQSRSGLTGLLSAQIEGEIRQWIIERRRGSAALQVTASDVVTHVNEKYRSVLGPRIVGRGWLQGFLHRARLSHRRRTTTKDVTSPQLLDTVARFRVQLQDEQWFVDDRRVPVFNMDETYIFCDMPAATTIDETGAKSVPIGCGKHEKDRVSIVLCVSTTGEKMPPLLIYKSGKPRSKKAMAADADEEKTAPPPKKKARRGKDTVPDNKVMREVVTVDGHEHVSFVAKNPTGYMNERVMLGWLTEMYGQHHTDHVLTSSSSSLSGLSPSSPGLSSASQSSLGLSSSPRRRPPMLARAAVC